MEVNVMYVNQLLINQTGWKSAWNYVPQAHKTRKIMKLIQGVPQGSVFSLSIWPQSLESKRGIEVCRKGCFPADSDSNLLH